MKYSDFVHLHVHSDYSLLDGAGRVSDYIARAMKFNMPALAITDRNNLFGALEFSETMSGEGIQPVIGCTLALSARAASEPQDKGRLKKQGNGNGGAGGNGANGDALAGSIALIAKDADGYANLLKLTSAAFLEHSEDGQPHATWTGEPLHPYGVPATGKRHTGHYR